MAEPIKEYDMIEYKGLVRSVSGANMDEASSPDMDCVELYEGYVRRARGIQEFSSAMSGNPRFFYEYIMLDGKRQLLGVSDTGLFVYANAVPTGSWQLLSAYEGVSGREVFGEQYLDKLVLVDGKQIMYYDKGTFAPLGGISDINLVAANYVSSFYSYLVLGNTYEGGIYNAWRVRWSDTGKPETWNSGNAGFVDLVDSPGPLTGLEGLFDRLFAYKERSIYGGAYTNDPRVFDWYLASPDVGCIAPKTLVTVGDIHLFLGHDNMYAWDGRTTTPFGDEIRPILFGPDYEVSLQRLKRSYGVYVPRLQEYWLAVPLEYDWPTYILRWHLPTKTWWPRTFSLGVCCFGNVPDIQPTTWAMMAGQTWGSLQGTVWEELGGSRDLTGLLVGTDSGRVGKLQWDSVQDMS